MNMPPSIFDYIKAEEAAYETEDIQIGDNWFWNMRKHIQMIFHLKNGIFYTGDNDFMRAFKNVMEPILNLSYWTEDIELKQLVFYMEGKVDRVLSFLIKKYHDEIYVKEHDIDLMFDEVTESDLDYGGALVDINNKKCPEVLALNTIAFCDQADIVGGVTGFKFNFSPGKLRSMSGRGWGKESNGATISIEDLIVLADDKRSPAGVIGGKDNKGTGKNIEVFVVHGPLPDHYLNDNDDMEYHCNQIQIVAFYNDPKSKTGQSGVVLYRKKAGEGNLRFFTSKKVHGRALGRGVGEGLLHPQVWTNFLTIHKTAMLEAGSKSALVTDDQSFTNKNRIIDMEQNEIITIEEGKTINRIPTIDATQIRLFEGSINEWYQQAQLTGSAFDSILGETAPSGTTFRGQERSVQQGSGLHKRRQGQRAKFFEELYRDAIIPEIKKEILGGKKFMASLDFEETKFVMDALVAKEIATMKKEYVLTNGGNAPTPDIEKEYEQKVRDEFRKKGSQHMLEILKGEFDDVEIRMGINIAGKQKGLAEMSDKAMSILQTALANPQNFLMTLQIPGMAAKFSDVLEFSNVNQVDFDKLIQQMNQQQQMAKAAPQGPQQPMQPQQPQLA